MTTTPGTNAVQALATQLRADPVVGKPNRLGAHGAHTMSTDAIRHR